MVNCKHQKSEVDLTKLQLNREMLNNHELSWDFEFAEEKANPG